MQRTQELQCRSSSKSTDCRESFVSFPYRVAHILASHSHIIPWMLPEKPVTVQISDSHGPGKNESPHAPVTQVPPTPISLHADLRHLFGSTGNGWRNQAAEGVRVGMERDSRKEKKKFGVFSPLVSFAGQISSLHSFTDHGSKHFFLYSQSSCFWPNIRTLARKSWNRQGQFISGYCSTSIRWYFPKMLWFPSVFDSAVKLRPTFM